MLVSSGIIALGHSKAGCCSNSKRTGYVGASSSAGHDRPGRVERIRKVGRHAPRYHWHAGVMLSSLSTIANHVPL